jgi:hypothetical protein
MPWIFKVRWNPITEVYGCQAGGNVEEGGSVTLASVKALGYRVLQRPAVVMTNHAAGHDVIGHVP